jgi:hypothetical protein
MFEDFLLTSGIKGPNGFRSSIAHPKRLFSVRPGIWWPEVEVNKEDPEKLKAGESKGIERTEESDLSGGESLVA